MKTLFALLAAIIATGQLRAQEWKLDLLSDYTTDSKATKSMIAGVVPHGFYVTPEENSTLMIWASPKLAEYDSKITWRVTAESLKDFGPGSIACYDAPTTHRKWDAKIIFRDLDKPTAKAVEKAASDKFAAGLDRFYIIYTDPTEEARTEIFECASLREFQEDWEKKLARSKGHRFIITDNMAWLTKVPLNAVESRQVLVSNYLRETEPFVGEIVKDPQSSVLATAMYKKKTDELFEQLNGKVIIDDKLKSYELYWNTKRDQLSVDGDSSVEVNIIGFRSNLLTATENTKCTVKVFATNGQNAEIRVAKRDRNFKTLGPSVVTTELERALYIFQAWRNGKMTGETPVPVDCTGKTNEVTITEK